MTLFDDAKAAGEAAERHIIEDAIARLERDLATSRADDAADDATIATLQIEKASLEQEVARLKAELDLLRPPAENPLRALSAIREFPHYRTKAYKEHDLTLEDLADLGVGAISGQLNYDTPASSILFYERAWKEHGIGLWATIGVPRVRWTAEQWASLKALLDGPLKGAVKIASNWNEPNHRRNPSDPPLTDWPQHLADQQIELWQTVDPDGSGIAIGTGQLHSGNIPAHEGYVDQMFMAKDNAMYHYSNVVSVHLYPRGGVGEHLIDQFYQIYGKWTGDRMMVCTESGYSNAINSDKGKPVTEEEAGVLIPLLFDAWHSRGGALSYFEHYDDPDPEDDDREYGFGIVDVPDISDPSTWRRKPGFHSLQQYLEA